MCGGSRQGAKDSCALLQRLRVWQDDACYPSSSFGCNAKNNSNNLTGTAK
jgi:hypothetical protein